MGSGFPDNKAVLKQKGLEISDVLDFLYQNTNGVRISRQ